MAVLMFCFLFCFADGWGEPSLHMLAIPTLFHLLWHISFQEYILKAPMVTWIVLCVINCWESTIIKELFAAIMVLALNKAIKVLAIKVMQWSTPIERWIGCSDFLPCFTVERQIFQLNNKTNDSGAPWKNLGTPQVRSYNCMFIFIRCLPINVFYFYGSSKSHKNLEILENTKTHYNSKAINPLLFKIHTSDL